MTTIFTQSLKYGLLGGTALVLVACSGSGGHSLKDADHVELIVASELRDCVGNVPQMCMLVKEAPEEEWSYFYDHIEGFEFEPGFEYHLKIDRSERSFGDTPLAMPQDINRYQYRLVKVTKKEAKHSANLPMIVSTASK